MCQGQQVYHCGDLCEYTGNTHPDEPGFWELRVLEGHKQGQLCYTQRQPDGRNPMQERSRQEWIDQQEQFSRLRNLAS